MRWADFARMQAVLGLVAGTAAGQPSDGTYGRFEGDVAVAGEVGGGYVAGPRGRHGGLGIVRLNLEYLSTVGLYGEYGEGFGRAPVGRTAGGGVLIKPLFLGRWARNMEQGPGWADLVLDSTSLSIGLVGLFPDPCPPRGPCRPYALDAGIGFELPFAAQARTPFVALRVAGRWDLAPPPSGERRLPPSAWLTLTVGYRHLFRVFLADAGDALPP